MSKQKKSQFLPDATFTFDDTAIVMLRTNFLNFEFVKALNEACDLQLSRVWDLTIDNADYPCFSHYNEHTRLAFVMLESPFEPTKTKEEGEVFSYYDKMLLIRGRDAWDFQTKFYNTVSTSRPEPDHSQPLNHDIWEHENNLREGIFVSDTFCFSPQRGLSTSLHHGPKETMPRSTTSYVNKLSTFLAATFKLLQWHLCDEEDEL